MKRFLLVCVALCFAAMICGCAGKLKDGFDFQNDNKDLAQPYYVEGEDNALIPPEEKTEDKPQEEVILDKTPVTAVVLQFNTTKAPFDDVNMRRAVAFAIEREALCKNIENASPMYGMIPQGIAHGLNPKKSYRDVVGEMYDDDSAEFAKLMLSKTGYKAAEFVENGYSITAKKGDGVSNAIMFQLLENAGIVLNVNYLEAEDYEKALKEHNYDVILVDYPCAQDAKEYFTLLGTSAWQNEDYISLLEDLDSYTNYETWDKLFTYEMLEGAILEDMAFVPLFSIGKPEEAKN